MNLRSMILFACLAANGARAKPVRVACIGDSVTEGSKSDGQPWCKQIRGTLGRNFFTTYNFGQSGATVVDYGTETAYIDLDGYEDWRAAVRDSCEDKDCCEADCARSPIQVGIISLGTNDAKTANLQSGETYKFVEEYKSLVTRIVQDLYEPDDDDPDDGGACPNGGSDLRLLVLASAVPIAEAPISQTNKVDWNEASKDWVANTLPGLVEDVRDWADNEFDDLHVKYVNLYDVLSLRDDYPDSLYDDDDRIHPGPEGHAVIAAALGAKVQEWCDDPSGGECEERAGCGGDASMFYPLKGDADDWEIDNSDENPYEAVGFATFGGITYGGWTPSAENVVYCDNPVCFEAAVERKDEGSYEFDKTRGKPLIVYLTADIATTSKNKIDGDEEGKLTIEGDGHTISYDDEDDCLEILDSSNVAILNVHFKRVGNRRAAIKINERSHHVLIQSCTFSSPGCGADCEQEDAAVVVEAPSTFVSIQKCKFDGVDRAVYVRNDEDDCDGHGAGRVTISESVFLNCRRETPRLRVGWVHVYNSLWIGGGDDGEGMIRVDPDNGAKPEILVEACNITDVEDAYENDDNGIGTIAESAVVMDDDSRDDADTAYAPSSLSWCVPPYDYDVVDASDPAAMQRIMDAAGAVADAPTAVPTAGPSPQPTAEPTPRPTADDTPAPTLSPTSPRPTVEPTIKPTAAPIPRPTAEPTATSTPAPTPAPTTPSPTSPAPTPYPTTPSPTSPAPTPYPTSPSPTLSCDSPEKFYPDTANQNGDEYKLTSEFSQTNPYNITGFAAWPHAGIAYGGFYGGKVTCYDADCLETALTETSGPLIIHLGQDFDLGSSQYTIKGDEDHDDKTLEGHGFTLKYSGKSGKEAPLFTDNGASNLVIRNVRFENTGEDSPAIQVRETSHHVVLDQCTFACSNPGECGYAVTVEAPATFVTIQRCLFDQVKKGIRVRNKQGDNGAGRVTVVECYFRNCEKESPDGGVGWVHMLSCVVEGGGDGDGMIKTDPDNGGVPELLVDGGRLSVSTGQLYKKDGGGLIAAVPGVTNSDPYPEAPNAPEDLSWCPPYDYTSISGFDDAAVNGIKENAGAQKEFPTCGVRISLGNGAGFHCEDDPSATEHAGKKIVFACCDADMRYSTCTRADADGECYAGFLNPLSNFAPKTYHEATNVCAAEGKVLCGVEQPCQNRGCHYNGHYQWTGEECQAGDAGLPAACAPPPPTPAPTKQTATPAPTRHFPTCGVRINLGNGAGFHCETDPAATEHAGKKIAFACCDADMGYSTCTRADADGQCYAGFLSPVSNFAPKDWHEATNVCAAEGKVLCGVDQPCQNRGCHYNGHYQWTGEECQAGDAGLPAACAPAGRLVVRGIKGVAPYCETDLDALVRDDGSGMGIAFACCNEDGSSGCTRTVSGSCNAGHWNQPVTWAPVKWLDAMEQCATYGKTLCGSSNAGRCQNTGCHYNNIYQWTNEACEPPPTVAPTGVLSYRPGELTVRQAFDGKYLDLSTGLSARIVAQTGRSPVSGAPPFHDKPDGGACFADPDPSNPGGWAYVSNSEVDSGGVGSLRFDASGAVIDYSMVLTGTRNNCGGGKSPWGTWLSAEEDNDRGRVWECDPFGRFPGRRVELVSQGGNYESVAYDDRAGKALAFYTTEDTDAGPLTRFIPDEQEPGPHDEGRGIRGPGSYEYLVLENDGNGGTYWWASEREDANAEDAYPSVEGIDIHEGVMYFVAKGIKRLYILDLDEGTYESSSTESGAFDQQPDQVARIVGDDILYFCEDGGPGKGGVHARDGSTGRSYPVRKSNFTCHRPSSSPHRFFTVLDGSSYGSETTGLAFSPDKKRMYVSFQGFGIFEITRDDGRVFDGATLDIKYHAAD